MQGFLISAHRKRSEKRSLSFLELLGLALTLASKEMSFRRLEKVAVSSVELVNSQRTSGKPRTRVSPPSMH